MQFCTLEFLTHCLGQSYMYAHYYVEIRQKRLGCLRVYATPLFDGQALKIIGKEFQKKLL